jgi:hypothetical protein
LLCSAEKKTRGSTIVMPTSPQIHTRDVDRRVSALRQCDITSQCNVGRFAVLLSKRSFSESLLRASNEGETSTDVLLDFLIFREAADLQFREYLFAVYGHFETATIRGNESEPFDFAFEFGDEFVGQTDRLGLVISSLAIYDFDFHITHFHRFAREAQGILRLLAPPASSRLVNKPKRSSPRSSGRR